LTIANSSTSDVRHVIAGIVPSIMPLTSAQALSKIAQNVVFRTRTG
jgi:hypothetical protein